MQTDLLLTRLYGELAQVLGVQRDIDHQRGHAHELRSAYLTGQGLPWRFSQNGSDSRRAEGEALQTLATEGLVKLKSAIARTNAVLITERGLDESARLLDLPGADSGWFTYSAIAKHMELGDFIDHLGKRWVPETALAKTAPDWSDTVFATARAELVLTEDMAIPAIARGWVVVNTDRSGRAYYSIGNIEPPQSPTGELPRTGPSDPNLWTSYMAGREAMRTRLLEPYMGREIGMIPIPEGVGLNSK